MPKIAMASKSVQHFKQKIGFVPGLILKERMDSMFAHLANPDVVQLTKLIYITKGTMALCILII